MIDATPSVPKETNAETKHEYVILYVEDNPANLRLVTKILSSLPDVKCITAHEPVSGLELAKKQLPDLILLDINLPTMDGYAVLQQLKESPDTKNTPVIAVSANAMPSDIQKSAAAGFVNHITKPIVITDFIEEIRKILPLQVNS
ncbi:MAG: response regulator [Gammaproteobacteria bacterium]|nr:response regulator [Gammaproteobacteria bacterium]